MAADHTRDILAVLYERPGPRGFAGPVVGRIDLADALAELAATDGPTSDHATRAAYEARVARRAAGRGGEAQ